MRRQDQAELLTWPRLGAGLIALLTVAGLLELLRRLIGRTLDDAVKRTWTTATQLAQNTQALQHLEPLRARVAELAQELERDANPTRGRGR